MPLSGNTSAPEPYISDIFIHPLKSGRSFPTATADIEWEGIAGDRRFLVTTPDGLHVTARSHPRMVLISLTDGLPDSPSKIFEAGNFRFVLNAPSLPALAVEGTITGSKSMVTVWNDTFAAHDCGDKAADWISAFHGESLRLHYLGNSHRPLQWDRERRLNFADAAPVLALSRSSVSELSLRAGFEVSVRRFRPNLVFGNTVAFEEDSWRRIAIGEIEFEVIDGCSRCELTTVDPETGEKHPLAEPLETLRKFRENDTGVYFGMNLMPVTIGTLAIGDRVRVLRKRRPLFFADREKKVPDIGPVAKAIETACTRGFGPARMAVTAEGSSPEAESGIPGQFEAICESVVQETGDVKSFVFRRLDKQLLRFQAGQFVTLDLRIDRERIYRSYSISSAPGDSCFRITVKRVTGGLASNWLHDKCSPGTVLRIEGPGGRFGIRNQPWESYLFLAAGSGITPFVSILQWMADENIPADVVLHYSARTRKDLVFEKELDALAQRLQSRLKLSFSLSRENRSHRPEARTGHIDYATLMEVCMDVRDRRILACGPKQYRAGIRELLAQARVKVDIRYSEEAFSPGEEFVAPATLSLKHGVVDFLKSETSVRHDGKTTVLKIAENTGLRIPYSCRAGDCGTCLVQKIEGTVRGFGMWTVPPAQADRGWFLSCSSIPDGDLKLDM